MTVVDAQLPGADLVEAGLEDLRCRRRSPEACLVAAGARRLRRLGVDVPDTSLIEGFPEHALYDALTDDLGQAGGYARYNAMLAQLDSFASALALLDDRSRGVDDHRVPRGSVRE